MLKWVVTLAVITLLLSTNSVIGMCALELGLSRG